MDAPQLSTQDRAPDADAAAAAVFLMQAEEFDAFSGVNVTPAAIAWYETWLDGAYKRLDLWLSWLGWTRIEAVRALSHQAQQYRADPCRGA